MYDACMMTWHTPGEEGQLGTGEEMSLGLPVEMGLLPDDVAVSTDY